MKTRNPIISVAAAAVLCAGCATSGSKQQLKWSTLPPSAEEPSALVKASGPYHLYHYAPLGIVNFDENYNGDDTPWIDLNDEFRGRVAEAMGGYEPEEVTLADVAVTRNGFLSERLGRDYVWKQLGRNGEELILVAGNKWESIDKYAWIRQALYGEVFKAGREPAARQMTIQVVHDVYWVAAGGRKLPVSEVTVYLYGFREHADEPVPRATYTQMPEDLVRALAVEGTERSVEGGTVVEVETPRGRRTLYRPALDARPGSYNWEWWVSKQDAWYVGKTLMKLLNGLPGEELLRLKDANE